MEPATATTEISREAPTGVSNSELIRWTFAVINSHDVEPLKPLWRDTVEHFPGLTARGPEEISAYFTETFAAMPDFRIEIQGMAEEGETVFVRWIATGHFTGAPFQGIHPTGSEIQLNGCDHFVIRDGRIVSNHVIYDQLDFAHQVGLLPPDGSAADRALKGAFNAKTRAVAKLRR